MKWMILEKHIKNFSHKILKERGNFGDLRHEMAPLKWVLRKYSVRM
jgi:hypothetical protein